MKFKCLNGKTISIDLREDAVCKHHDNYSKGQINLGQLLEQIYPTSTLFEDFIIPGERLSIDFFISDRNLAFEFDGIQHKKFNKFFHKNKQDFTNQKRRDMEKVTWCQINNITLIRIQNSKILIEELKREIKKAILKQSN